MLNNNNCLIERVPGEKENAYFTVIIPIRLFVGADGVIFHLLHNL